MEKNNANQNMVINKGKIPEKITFEGTTKPTTLSIKLTVEENSRFTADFEHSGMSSKTDYVKHRLFNNKPLVTLSAGREIFEKLSECADLLHNLSEGNSIDRQQDIKRITEKLGKVEADIAFTWDCIDAVNNGKEVM